MKYLIKKVITFIVGILALSSLFASHAFAARTDNSWIDVSGQYLKTTFESGINILINGTNKYLNFGSISGSSGYGFRDSGGVMQFKNSSGSWTNFGSGGGGLSDLSTFTTDDLTEGLTNLYYTDARSRSALSSSATGLSYDNGTGIFSLTSGYNIPLTASTTAWNAFYNTPSSVITAGTGLSWAGNTLSSTLTSSQWSNLSSNIYYNTGNVGIGTSTPEKKLEVLGKVRIQGSGFTSSTLDHDLNIIGKTSATTGYPFVMLVNRQLTTNSLAKIGFNAGDGTAMGFFVADLFGVGTGSSYESSGLDSPGIGIQVYTAHPFMVKTDNIERFRITSAGNVGIGTTTPNWKLSVAGNGSFDDYVRASYFVSTSTATSTFAGGIQTDLINVTSTTATSTFANGINLNTGCFAINGTCLTSGGGGGSVAWGGITGTLSNQTDLQSALDAKADDTDLNSYLALSDWFATTTDALAEGSTNRYYSDTLVGAYISASSSIPHKPGTAYGDILYWNGSLWDTMATSTLGIGGGGSVAWGGITGTLSDQTDLQTALDGKVDENSAITGATKTKITYDAKGLVTAGADATTADIADSTDKRYVTDAQLTVVGNTSGTNTGDQTTIVGITGTKSQFDTAVTDGNFMYIGDAPTSHTHTASEITDFDTEVSNNSDVSANTSARHSAVTVLDSSQIDFTLTGQQVTGSVISGSIGATQLASNQLTNTVVFEVDGHGSAVTTGTKKAYVKIPYDCTITSWDIVADQTGSAVIDVWYDTYGNFPPTVADTITASAKPTLSSAQKAQSSTLTGWTTSLTAGSYLEFNVDSISGGITKLKLTLLVTKN